MKFTISTGLTGAQVRGRIPPRLRARVPESVRDDASYALIVFRGPEVVSSSVARRALDRLGRSHDALVAAGPNFTTEARTLLATRKAILVAAGDLEWTDSSVQSVNR